MTLMTGAEMVTLPACTLLHLAAERVENVTPGDASAGLCWAMHDGPEATGSICSPSPMDELTAMVLQESVFEQPRDPETLRAALIYLSRRLHSIPVTEAAEGQSNDLTERICRHMAANTDSPLSLDDLCAYAGCSRSALLRAFRNAGLPSPMRYLADLRIGMAKERLRQSEWSISNIASNLGFSDLASFSHFFRARTGRSPREYRESCRWLL